MSTSAAPSQTTESPTEAPELLFYDGDCGVCHWAVKFVVQRDETGRAFRFAPLHGPTFEQAVPADMASQLPDSMLVHTRDGRLLMRSSGVVHILRRLGGFWPALGLLIWIVPRPLRNLGYDLFARIRHHFVAKPSGTCPLLPPEFRGRFDP